jgi:RimJ/RimL family protein N-acetyltransferase
MKFNLRHILFSDWELLLEWRNDISTRKYFFNDELIDSINHKKYIKSILTNKKINQYILEIDNIAIGTMKSTEVNVNEYELSYTISPKFRGKNLATILMQLFLYDKNGIFTCKIKSDNIPSKKMVERCGYNLHEIQNDMEIYKIEKI